MDRIKDKVSFYNALRLSLGINIILYMVMYLIVISKFNEQVTNRTEEWTFETGMSSVVTSLGISFLLALIAMSLVQLKRKILSGIMIIVFSVVQLLTMESLRWDFVDLSKLAYSVSDHISGAQTTLGATITAIMEVVIIVSVALALGMILVAATSRKKNVITVENAKLSKADKYIKWSNVLVGASAGLYLIIGHLTDELEYYDFTRFNIKEILSYMRLDWLAMELLGIGIPFMLFIVVVGGALVKRGHYILNIILYALYICMVYNALFWEKSWSYYEFEYEDMAGFPQYICMVILGAMVMLGGVFLKLGTRYGAKLAEKSKEGMNNEGIR